MYKKNIVNNNEGTFYLLDNSKSLWRLIHLLKSNSLDVKVVYIQRDIHGNVNSFKKHGFTFLSGLIIYLLNNFLIKRFLKENKVSFININYHDLCTKKKEVINRISNFLKIKIGNYSGSLHIPSGNPSVLHINSNEINIVQDKGWIKGLNGFEKKILSLFK